MRDYESLFIIKPDLADEDMEKEIRTVTDLIAAEGGQLTLEDRWGKRRLGYAIKKQRYGAYVLLRYTAEPKAVAKIDRHFRLHENVLKFLTVIFDGAAGKVTAVADVEEKVVSDDDEDDADVTETASYGES